MSRGRAMADRERTARAIAQMAPADRPAPARGSRWKALLLIAAAGTAIYFLCARPKRDEPVTDASRPPGHPGEDRADGDRHALLAGGVHANARLSAGMRVNVTDGHWQGTTGTIRRVQYDSSGERPTHSVLVDLDEHAVPAT